MKRRRLMKREPGTITRSRWHSLEEYESALRLCMGFKSEVARILNVAPATITNRIDKSEHLQEVLKEITEESLDTAERQLHEAVLAREGWAVLFVLRCKGKSRGWQERQQVDIDIRPVGGVLQVPYQFASSEEFEKVARKQQKELMERSDNNFSNDEDNDVEEQDFEEEEQQQYNFNKGE